MLFCCVDPRFFQNILQNYGFFSKKNWDIWNPMFQQNSIVYYLFFIFLAFFELCFLFYLSKLGKKLWNFLWCFIGRIKDFTSDFWKISKSSLKKMLICEIFFYFKIQLFTICFFIFSLFLTFIFNFVYLYLSKNSRNF